MATLAEPSKKIVYSVHLCGKKNLALEDFTCMKRCPMFKTKVKHRGAGGGKGGLALLIEQLSNID